VLERIRELAERGISFVIATHDPAVVAVADHTLTLDHGSVRGSVTDAGVEWDDRQLDETPVADVDRAALGRRPRGRRRGGLEDLRARGKRRFERWWTSISRRGSAR
jgi:ABC-type glutathione transport system ATPase component